MIHFLVDIDNEVNKIAEDVEVVEVLSPTNVTKKKRKAQSSDGKLQIIEIGSSSSKSSSRSSSKTAGSPRSEDDVMLVSPSERKRHRHSEPSSLSPFGKDKASGSRALEVVIPSQPRTVKRFKSNPSYDEAVVEALSQMEKTNARKEDSTARKAIRLTRSRSTESRFSFNLIIIYN